jgi:DNA-binding response OmpR family regulator
MHEEVARTLRIFLIGLEPAVAARIGEVLTRETHRVEQRSEDIDTSELMTADIIFACGEGSRYLTVLRRVRNLRLRVPFFVAARIPSTIDWLNALEAGATDYCASPFEPHQLQWLIVSALSGWKPALPPGAKPPGRAPDPAAKSARAAA